MEGKRGRPEGYSPSADSRAKTSASWQRKRERQDLQERIINSLKRGQEDQARALLEELAAFDTGSELIAGLSNSRSSGGAPAISNRAPDKNSEIQARMADARMDATMHPPIIGVHAHPHAAFGAESTDGIHVHPHRHYNDNEHAHLHREP